MMPNSQRFIFLLACATVWRRCWSMDEPTSFIQHGSSRHYVEEATTPASASANEQDIPDDDASLETLRRNSSQWISSTMRIGAEVVSFSGNFVTHSWGGVNTVLVDGKDYTQDVKDYMAIHEQGVGEKMPSMPSYEAEREWERFVALSFDTADNGTELASRLPHTVQDDLRRDFIDKVFNSSPVVLTSDLPKDIIHGMSREGLETAIGHLRVKTYAYAYPGWYFTLEPKVMTFKEFAERSADRLAGDGSARVLFINEPYVRIPLRDQLKIFNRLRHTFLPLMPEYAIQPSDHHGIFIVDTIGSSHGFHYHGPVWNTQVVGRKAWWLMKPTYLREPNSSRMYLAPSVNNITYAQPNACAYLSSVAPPPEAISLTQNPGETILLPEDYWHATCALDEFTSAFGGWMHYQACSEPTCFRRRDSV